MGPSLFPVIGVSGHLDVLVWFELGEFERAGADRMTAHLAWCDMAGIDRRPARGEHCHEGGLRPFQTKGDLVIAVGGDIFEIAIPRLAGIETQLFADLAAEHVPGALDILGGKRLAVVPLDALPLT